MTREGSQLKYHRRPPTSAIGRGRQALGPAVLTLATFLGGLGLLEAKDPVTNCTALALEQALQGGGTVRFECSGTITNSTTILIANDTILDARGYDVTLSGASSFRLITVQTNVSLTLYHLRLSSGSATGLDGEDGAAGESGAPGLPGYGGAIFNDGGIVGALDTVFTNNSARGGDGGDGAAGEAFGVNGESGGRGGLGAGGAIYNRGGSIHLTNCILGANAAQGGSGGIGGDGATGVLNGDGGRGGRGGGASGGAIHNTAGGRVRLIDCTLSLNVAVGLEAGQGGLGNGPLAFDGRPGAVGDGLGGALSSDSGRVELVNCALDANVARGGIGADGLAGVASRRGADGASGGGGGGGAFCISGGSLSATNCTFYANTAQGGDGGAGGNGGQTGFGGDGGDGGPGGDASGGGGLMLNAGSAVLVSCTFTTNRVEGGIGGERGEAGAFTADPGGQGSAGEARGGSIANEGGVVELANCILGLSPSADNASGAIKDRGHNLCSDDSAEFDHPESHNRLDPNLGPFGDYGGLTRTVALLAGSPAIDCANAAVGLPIDQRAYPRETAADIGAFESGAVARGPVLHLERCAGGVAMSWPFWAYGFRLQQTLSLSGPAWVDDQQPSIAGGEFVVTNLTTSGCGFFRLRR